MRLQSPQQRIIACEINEGGYYILKFNRKPEPIKVIRRWVEASWVTRNGRACRGGMQWVWLCRLLRENRDVKITDGRKFIGRILD